MNVSENFATYASSSPPSKINLISQQSAASGAVSVGCCRRGRGRVSLRGAGRHPSPNRRSDGPSLSLQGRPRIRPHQGVERSSSSGKSVTLLRVSHPSTRCSSRRTAAYEFLDSMPVLRRSSGVMGSSLLLQLRLIDQRTREPAQSVAPPCWLQDRSYSTSRLIFRKMLRALFQRNLALLGSCRSFGLLSSSFILLPALVLAVHLFHVRGRRGLAMRSLDQIVSYCVQPSSITRHRKDRAELTCEA